MYLKGLFFLYIKFISFWKSDVTLDEDKDKDITKMNMIKFIWMET
jgi:hypothetical protein